MEKTKNYEFELPEEGRNISEEFPVLRDNLNKIDHAIFETNTKVGGKAEKEHVHDLNEISDLATALSEKMPADKKFTIGDLIDVKGSGEAKNGYVLNKTSDGFAFGSPAAVIGKHQHKVEDIVDIDEMFFGKDFPSIKEGTSINRWLKPGGWTINGTYPNGPLGSTKYSAQMIVTARCYSANTYTQVMYVGNQIWYRVGITTANQDAEPWRQIISNFGGTFTGDVIRDAADISYGWFRMLIPNITGNHGGFSVYTPEGDGIEWAFWSGFGWRLYVKKADRSVAKNIANIGLAGTNLPGPLTVDGQRIEPPGEIGIFAMNKPPAGWLKCNGAAISRETYADLFKVLGTTYGAGDGSTTFNIPDARGEFIRGWADDSTVDKGRKIGSKQGDAIRNITGGLAAYGWELEGISGAFSGQRNSPDFSSPLTHPSRSFTYFNFDASKVVPTAAENRPRNIAFLVCIKY